MTLMRLLARTVSAAWPLLLVLPQPAAAQPLSAGSSLAILAEPPARLREDMVIDGRIWSCDQAVCQARRQGGARPQPSPVECAHVAKHFGAFSAYRTGSTALDDAQLSQCNAGVRR